jgi:hypothetical protein
MTTKVTVEPAGHTIEVATYETANVTKEVLQPGTPPRDFWIYSGKSLTIKEIEPASA